MGKARKKAFFETEQRCHNTALFTRLPFLPIRVIRQVSSRSIFVCPSRNPPGGGGGPARRAVPQSGKTRTVSTTAMVLRFTSLLQIGQMLLQNCNYGRQRRQVTGPIRGGRAWGDVGPE